jgi:hypothetical protein
VHDARAIFGEKTKNGGGFYWEDVLGEFRKMGGSTTEKIPYEDEVVCE